MPRAAARLMLFSIYQNWIAVSICARAYTRGCSVQNNLI